MNYLEPELKNSLIKLDKLLKKYPDNSGEIMAYTFFKRVHNNSD